MTPTIKLQLSDPQLVRRLKPTKAQLARAQRLVINRIVDMTHKELGGSIPKRSGVRVGGFRKVRAKKNKAKVRQKTATGVVWLGGNKVQAKFGGRLKQTKKGAYAGRHYWANAFVAKMKNGYESIFRRTGNGKLEEMRIDVVPMHEIASRSVARNSENSTGLLRKELTKILNKNAKRKL